MVRALQEGWGGAQPGAPSLSDPGPGSYPIKQYVPPLHPRPSPSSRELDASLLILETRGWSIIILIS